jgi:hypothetical protein
MQPGDLMMYDGEILCLVLETGVDFYGSKRVRVQTCGPPPEWRTPRLCSELLIHAACLEPLDATG